MILLHKITTVATSLKPYEDYLLNGLFLLIGLYAFIEAQTWGFAAGTWPRLTAAIVIVLSILILSKRFLPEWLRSQISEGDTMFSRRQKKATNMSHSDEKKEPEQKTVSPAIVTGIFTICYAAGGYLIGFLWATPAFVFAYTRWNDTTLINALTLTAASFSISYGFWLILDIPISTGILTEVILL